MLAGDIVERAQSPPETAPPSVTDGQPRSVWQNPQEAGDVNRDGTVTAVDAVLIINRLTRVDGFDLASEREDHEHYLDPSGDGRMSPLDALLVINKITQIDGTLADTTEATALALEETSALTPRPEIVANIVRDLANIRRSFPEVSGLRHTPDYTPGRLVLGVTPEWQNSDELRSLNERFGAEVVHQNRSTDRPTIRLNVPANFNIPTLAQEYRPLRVVRYAEPNYIAGGPTSDISRRGDLREGAEYVFSAGYGDCPAGCIYRAYWTFLVNDDHVELVSKTGDHPVPTHPGSVGASAIIVTP